MTDAIQEQAAMELAWRTEAKAADLKPEDRALIERKLVLAIIAASHQQPMTSPTAVSDVLSTPQVRAAIDALATSLSDPTGEVGGVEPVACVYIRRDAEATDFAFDVLPNAAWDYLESPVMLYAAPPSREA